MITNYIPNMCGYGLNNLKKVVHIFSESANVIHIDNGEAYVTSGITDLQTISATSVSFEETTAYDDRFKFQKTVTATVNGFAKLSELGGKYYIVLEDVNGIMWLVNADFPSLVTYTYTLQDGTDETVFTFSALSNFPTFKLNASINNAYACQNYSLVRVDEIKMLEKRYANINASTGIVYGYSNQVYKTVRPYRNSIKVEETFDGTDANTTIQFSIGLDDYQSSWHYNMLEYPYNKYVAVIDHLACGFEMGLVPSYNVQGSHQIGGGDTVTVTLVGGSQRGSEWAESWMEVTVAPVYEWRLSDEWMCQPVEYRWTESGYTCIGYDKYQNNIKEVSTDGGETWSVMLPEEYSASTLIEEYSMDCGWIPPLKYLFIRRGGEPVSALCETENETISGSEVPSDVVSAYIGDCVTNIANNAFVGRAMLAELTIGSGLTSIGTNAFSGCTSLTSVTLPDSLSYIGGYSFAYCSNLSEVKIGSGITNIDYDAFYYCERLKHLYVNAVTPPGLNQSAFYYTPIENSGPYGSNSGVVYVPCGSVGTYQSTKFWRNYAIRCATSDDPKYIFTLSDSSVVSAVCDNTYTVTQKEGRPYRTSLVNAVVGNCVTSIGSVAFSGCTALTSVTLSDSLTTLNTEAFAYCSSLESIELPDSVTTIGTNAFAYCTDLINLTIPSGVTNIGDSAFRGCANLSYITINATTPPSLTNNAFLDTNDCPIYVPSSAVETYKSTTGWSYYASRIYAIPGS